MSLDREVPVRVLVSEASQETFNQLYAAFLSEPARVSVASLALTVDVLKRNLADIQPDVAVIDGEFIGDMGEKAFLQMLSGLGRTVAIVMLPPQWQALEGKLRNVERVRDVVTKPVSPANLVERAIELGLAERARVLDMSPGEAYLDARPRREGYAGQKVIAVYATKGGPGKTTVAENLWYWICTTVGPALLVGFDVPDDIGVHLGLPMAPNMLSYFRRPGQAGFQASLQKHEGFDVMLSVNDELEADKKDNVALIPKVIMAARDEPYVAIIMDLPPTTSEWALEPMLRANQVIVVIEPHIADVNKAIRGIQLLSDRLADQFRVRREKFCVVMNKTRETSNLSVKDAEILFRHSLNGWAPPIVARIPDDPYVSPAQNDQILPLKRRGVFSDGINALGQVFFPHSAARTRATSSSGRGLFPFRIRIGGK